MIDEIITNDGSVDYVDELALVFYNAEFKKDFGVFKKGMIGDIEVNFDAGYITLTSYDHKKDYLLKKLTQKIEIVPKGECHTSTFPYLEEETI